MINNGLSAVTEHRSDIKTIIDQSNKDSETWGDNIAIKNKQDFRCCFQNINGLGYNKDDPKRESIRQFINENKVDFYLMAEINVNWRVISNNRSIHDMTKGWFEIQKVQTSFNRHCRTCHKHQPGGTAIISQGTPALHFDSAGEDSRFLGRWCWQRFRGKQDQHFRVISVYFPTRSSSYGNKKVYDQQQKALLGMGITAEVHKTFWKDFWSEVDAWLLSGDKLIIGGDWNLKITCPALLNEFRKRNLLPAISGKFDTEPPPTYHRAKRHAIDEIFASAEINVTKAGYLPFGTGVGDHRPIWFDFSITSCLGSKLPKLFSFPSRRLKCQDPSIQHRYVKVLTTFLEKHNVFERSSNLFSHLSSPLSAEHISEYECLDKLRAKGMHLAEKKCRKLFLGGKSWSPVLQQARDTIKYLSLCISKLKGCKVSTRVLIRMSKSLHIYCEGQTLLSLENSLSSAFEHYASIKKDHRQLRNTFLENLAARHEDAGKGKKATHLRLLLSLETQRDVFRQLRFYNKSSDNMAIKELRVTNTNGEQVIINDQLSMETSMGEENMRKYHQTEDTCPFFHPNLRTDFGDLADGPCVQQVLDGTYTPAPEVDSYTKSFLESCQRKPNSCTQLDRDKRSFQHSWSKMKEKTSSRDLHFGHFKTGVEHDRILQMHFELAEIPFRTGYSPTRWQEATQLMILKKLGLIDVERLRTLVLYEADFNHNNKFLGKSMMEHMQKHSFLAKEQYSAPGKKCIDHVLNRRLLFDITRYSKQSLGLTGCDLSSCYDRVTHTPAMLAMASYGIPMQPLTSMFKTIQNCKSYIRTAFGESVRSFGGHDDNYIALPMGLGQGNGSGPSVWTIISTKMFEVMYKHDLASFFMTPITNLPLEICGFAFVDDTDLVCSVQDMSSSLDTLNKMQKMVDTWEGVAKTTGGAIETSPDKSWWYLVDFQWNNGSFSYVDHSLDPKMILTARNKTGSRDALTYVPPHIATEMLGVYIAPTGDESRQISKMITESKKLARKFAPAPLRQSTAWIALTCIANSKLRYPLPATTLSEKTCKSIIWPLLEILLPKCNLTRRFPQKLLYGPGSCLGLDLPCLFLQQGIYHVADIIEHLHYHDVTGHLIRTEIEHLHLESGQARFSLSDNLPTIAHSLLTTGWVLETWKFMHQYNITIDLPLPTFPLRRQYDQYLMKVLTSSNIPPNVWKQFNQCRLYLHVISLADICTGDGLYICENAFKGTFIHGTSRNNISWPPRESPSRASWRIWSDCLIKLFCEGTNGKLSSRLGSWYPIDSCYQWEWYINHSSSHLLHIVAGEATQYPKVGRSRIAPRFSMKAQYIDTYNLDDYLRTTVVKNKSFYLAQGSEITGLEPPIPDTPAHFEWLHFKTVHTDSIEDLLSDLINHSAIAVTDGSYKPFEETGAAAWTIESASGHQYVSGISLIPGSLSVQSAIRSELVGVLAILAYMDRLKIDHSLPAVGGHLGCDCRSALETTFYSFRTPRVNDHHADIKSAIHHYMSKQHIHLKPTHIFAHQDDFLPYSQLTRLEKMNVRMDSLAKQARIEYASLIHQTSLPIQIPYSFAQLRIEDIVIHGNLQKSLSHQISAKQAQAYWISKRLLSVETAKMVYYEAIGRASALSRLSMKIFISKWASGHIGTGKVVQRNQYRLDGSCPFCLAPNEDTDHILDCQHEEAQGLWKKHLLTFVFTLHKYKFPVTFIIAIKRELSAWRLRRVPPLLSTYPEPTRSMISDQRLIGWNQFLLGFIPSSWNTHFVHILRDKHLLRRYSPVLWASKLIRATWQFIHDTWEARCRKLHETDLIHDLSGKTQLLLSIKAELAIGLHNLPACDFSRLFSIPTSTLLNKPLEYLKDWFVTIRSARILYNDTSLLTDLFTTEISLRRWVGLPTIVDHDSENEFSDHE